MAVTDGGRDELRADCQRCAGLCCVLPEFTASADFAISKPAGQPCRHLQPDHRCAIHTGLRERGFPGCAAFDCFGAGQQVTQVTFAGRDWRRQPALLPSMSAVFPVMRQLRELLWYLAEALTLPAAGPLHAELAAAQARTSELTAASAAELAAFDLPGWRRQAGDLLARVSELARAEIPDRVPDRPAADLIGARLRGADLHGASLRGAYLIGADLRGASLRGTDLLGTDLRAADLRGADLSGSLFLTQQQLSAARGDGLTALPAALTRPGHWPRAGRGRSVPRRREPSSPDG